MSGAGDGEIERHRACVIDRWYKLLEQADFDPELKFQMSMKFEEALRSCSWLTAPATDIAAIQEMLEAVLALVRAARARAPQEVG